MNGIFSVCKISISFQLTFAQVRNFQFQYVCCTKLFYRVQELAEQCELLILQNMRQLYIYIYMLTLPAWKGNQIVLRNLTIQKKLCVQM